VDVGISGRATGIFDGQTFIEARPLKYGPQKADLFRMPANYTLALAPEGAE
jgi:hypothetical protein